MKDQDRRNDMLKLLLEYRKLVQFETLADGMTHDAKELKDLSDACGMKLADILSKFDDLIGGFVQTDGLVGYYSPGIQKLVDKQHKELYGNG